MPIQQDTRQALEEIRSDLAKLNSRVDTLVKETEQLIELFETIKGGVKFFTVVVGLLKWCAISAATIAAGYAVVKGIKVDGIK